MRQCSVDLLYTCYPVWTAGLIKCSDVSIYSTDSAQRAQGMCSVELHLVIIELLKTQTF